MNHADHCIVVGNHNIIRTYYNQDTGEIINGDNDKNIIPENSNHPIQVIKIDNIAVIVVNLNNNYLANLNYNPLYSVLNPNFDNFKESRLGRLCKIIYNIKYSLEMENYVIHLVLLEAKYTSYNGIKKINKVYWTEMVPFIKKYLNFRYDFVVVDNPKNLKSSGIAHFSNLDINYQEINLGTVCLGLEITDNKTIWLLNIKNNNHFKILINLMIKVRNDNKAVAIVGNFNTNKDDLSLLRKIFQSYNDGDKYFRWL